MLYRCGHFLLVTLVRFNCACNSSEHRQLSIGLTWTLAIEPNEGNLHVNVDASFLFELIFAIYQPDSAAMFPGRFPNVPDSMWNYGWSPQPMGLQGQFCAGDVMNQQSQAQSQAQTQAQLAALREQNSILNQQLASQAQSHIQHLQQLIPFHQPTSTPPTPQLTPPASEPPTPVAPPSTQPGSSVSFNPEEMMQQMKNTVESSIQRSINQLPSPSLASIPAPPQSSSHLHPPDDAPTLHHRSHRRSRSQRHRSASRRPDKRPISILRSPRRHKSPRRTRRSSPPRSSSRRRISTSRRPSRALSITLRSASPRHREGRHRDQDDHQPQEPTHTPATLQPATWENHPQQSYYNTNTQSNYYHYDQHTTNKWQSRGQWKDYSKSSNTSNASGWIDYTKPISDPSHHNSSTKPLTAYSSYHNNPPRQPPHRSGSLQSRGSTNVPPGRVAINLQDGSRDEWARHITYAMNHPDSRMRAANEIPAADRPKPSTTMDQEDYDKAREQLHEVDPRIPPDVVKKAVQLLFSTNLLPDYDLSTCHVRELPSTSTLALIMPLPDTSHFQMPPPYGKRQNHTWALLHGTSLHTSQQILLEGKIRPANWSYHKNPQRCDLPTFGAFFLGREVSNSDKTIPPWAEKELLDAISKKGKGQQDIVIGAMYRGSSDHTAYKAGGNEKAQLGVIEKGIVTTSEKYTIAHSNHVGLKFVALKWADLNTNINVGDTSSDDCNYRSNEERYSGRHRWQALNNAQVLSCIISYIRPKQETESF